MIGLVPDPLPASNARPAVIYRAIDMKRYTLIIDEGDFRQSDEQAEITKILNNGNARGFPVLRSEVNSKGEYNPTAFRVFGDSSAPRHALVRLIWNLRRF